MSPPRKKPESTPLQPLDALPASPQLRVDGITPARQARSEATFKALLQAGREALEQGALESMTISDLARAAGASVGAFYGRFENKDVFFSAVQHLVVAEAEQGFRALLDKLERDGASVTRFLETVAGSAVTLFRENRGLYRAAFKHSSAQPGAWTPFKQLGWTNASLLVERLLPRLAREGVACDAMQIRVAAQFVNSLLVNATINDPGPIRLDDPAMVEHITRFLCLFLGVERVPKALRKKRKPA